MMGAFALGDVLTHDQDNRAVLYQHRSGRFADPEHRAVLADLAEFPTHRPAELFAADGDIPLDGLAIGVIKHVEHGMTD